MNDASSPVESYGVLAESCLAHPAWPPSLTPKPRSLSALFSKLDRNIELEWLADREGVQHVLASLLGCPLQRIRQALEGAWSVHDEGRPVYRFPSAPRARPLELLREPLPPGLPELLSTPRRWQHHVWSAPRGEGVPLVAAWLQARGLANPVFAQSSKQALERLDSGSANLVVLDHWDEPTVEWPRCPLCVVALGPIPPGFEAVAVPSYEARIEGWVEWFAARLPPDGRFDPEFTRDWLMRHPELAPDFESATSLIALIDELGVRSVEKETALGLAEAFAARRIADASTPGESLPWVRGNALAVLIGLASACATQSFEPFARARLRDEWVKLVPDEYRRGLDVSWAKASLARAGAPISKELDRAMTLAPPGAFRAIADLERAGLFKSEDGDTLRPVPAWLVRVVESQALQRIAASSVSEWGEAVIAGHAQGDIHRLLVERLRDGDEELLESVLELEESRSNVAAVAAVEAVTRALGEALLDGAELDPALSGAFLALQKQWLVKLPKGELRPRIGARDPEQLGSFLLGLWALQDAVESQGETSPTSVDLGPSGTQDLDVVLFYLQQCTSATWVYEAYGLLGRLARRLVPSHACVVPSAVVRDPKWASLARLARLKHGVDAVRYLCGGDVEWARLATEIWRSWRAAGSPDTDLFEGAPELWRHAPHDVLKHLAERSHDLLAQAPWPSLSDGQLTAVLETATRSDSVPWSALPQSVAVPALALALRCNDVPGMAALWRTSADGLLRAVDESLRQENAKVLARLLETAPSEHTDAIRSLLEAAIASRGVAHPAVDCIRDWALEQCSVRGPGRRAAYALLDDIETRLGRVRLARGAR